MIPSMLMQLDFSTGGVEPPPSADGIFGLLLLVGVGRILVPFTLSPFVLRFLQLW